MQTPTKPMHIAEGHFMLNGGKGYVLKPKILLDKGERIKSHVTKYTCSFNCSKESIAYEIFQSILLFLNYYI